MRCRTTSAARLPAAERPSHARRSTAAISDDRQRSHDPAHRAESRPRSVAGSLSPCARWRSTSSVARRPSPARSTCSSPGRRRVLIDCGMFQGSPNESIRNRLPFDFDPADARRRPPDPRPPRPLRADPEPGQGRAIAAPSMRRPARSSSRRWSCWTRASSTRSSPSATCAGRSATPTRPRPRTASRRRPTRPRSPSPPTARTGSGMRSGGTGRGERAGRDEQPRREAPARDRRCDDRPSVRATGEHVETSIEPDLDPTAPATWPTDPEAELRAQPPQLAGRPRRAALHGAGRGARHSRSFRPIEYDQELEVAPGVKAVFEDAGHILGSAIIRLTSRTRAGGEERVIVCSGDLGRPGHADPARPDAADRRGLRARRVDVRRPRTRARGGGRSASSPRPSGWSTSAKGVLLVPSFAIGRTQEIVWELDRLIERGEIPLLPLFLDSPMASKASDVYRHHPDYYDEETAKLLRDGASPLDYPNQTVTNDVKASQAIAQVAAAVHDRRLERDADRRPRRRPPAQPHRRPDRRRSCSWATRGRGRSGRTSRPARAR